MNSDNSTPMLRQYLEIKKQYPGTILFFRLGDFYELFNEDAVTGARELEITLTARHKDSPNPVPMCGVPHHAAANYISRLVKKGYRVAICEQTEVAGQGKKLVSREVVRIITPGTAIDPQLVESRKESFISLRFAARAKLSARRFWSFRPANFSPRRFPARTRGQKSARTSKPSRRARFCFPNLCESSSKAVSEMSRKIRPTEKSNVVSIAPPPNANKFSATLTGLDDWLFQTEDCENVLKNQFGVRELVGFGISGKPEAIRSAGACLRYAKETQRAAAEHIAEINYFEANDFMVLDAVTLKNLEISESRGENNKRCLFSVIDATVTGMGARLLRSWLLRPSIKRCGDSNASRRRFRINRFDFARQNSFPFKRSFRFGTPRRTIESRNGDAARSFGSESFPFTDAEHQSVVIGRTAAFCCKFCRKIFSSCRKFSDLIARSISDEPPVNLSDGGVIRARL